MSTRAIYTFIDNTDTFHVYKHHDGYPKGALQSIQKAKEFSWKLPRFDSNEFSVAFIAANKEKRGGDMVLVHSHDSICDIAYRYEIMEKEGQIYINAFSVKIVESIFHSDIDDEKEYDINFDDCIFQGILEEFEKFCKL